MDDKLLIRLLDSVSKYPLNTWAGFCRVIPIGFLIAVLIEYKIIMPFLVQYLDLSHSLIKYFIILSFSLTLLIYLIYFLFQRLILYINISLSKKINIVLAYNLESVLILNEEKFNKKYKALKINLENYIKFYGLNNFIKLVVAPPDISLSNSSAEAKTKLGLKGATLLVWGNVVLKQKTHFYNTNFSYEFGYSKNLVTVDKAKENARKYIESFTDKKLYPSVTNRLSLFEENLFLTCLFILGFSTFTVGNFEKSELLFEAFRNTLKKSNLITMHDFSPLNDEVKRLLVRIYIFKFNKADLSISNKNVSYMKSIANKIIEIDPKNYNANITLALISEIDMNRQLALKYNQIAEENSGVGDYDYLFNNAYFSLSDGDFTKALKIYNDIPKNQQVRTYTSTVSNFMNKKYIETSKPEFLFADGYVCYLWDDRDAGKKILREFIKKANEPYLSVLKKEAKSVAN